MMSTLNLELDRAEGSLQRLIGLIERRGFHIDAIVMGDQCPATRSLAVSVRARDAGRCAEVLGRQIDKLYGVRRMSGAQDRGSRAGGPVAWPT